MQVIKSDSLEFLKNQKDYENDIIFADPPYALGSEIIIRKDGKVDYAKATDFMNCCQNCIHILSLNYHLKKLLEVI